MVDASSYTSPRDIDRAFAPAIVGAFYLVRPVTGLPLCKLSNPRPGGLNALEMT